MSALPYAVAARGLLRTTVLDAVGAQLAVRPWAQVRMLDVAAAAGVSRQTLYKEFGSRAELAQEYVLREADRLTASVEDAVRLRRDDPPAALAAAFDLFLARAAEDPLVRAMVAGGDGGDELLALVTTQGAPVLRRAVGRLQALFGELWPQAAARDAALLGEGVVRLAISSAALPVGATALDGDAVARLLGPYADRALGGP